MKYAHPVSGEEIDGIRLGPGTTLIEGDVYDSSGGKWRPVPCVGSVIQLGCKTLLIRPTDRVLKGQCWSVSQWDPNPSTASVLDGGRFRFLRPYEFKRPDHKDRAAVYLT